MRTKAKRKKSTSQLSLERETNRVLTVKLGFLKAIVLPLPPLLLLLPPSLPTDWSLC